MATQGHPLSLGLKGPLQLPNLKGVVHPQAERAIRLLYQSQNDLAETVAGLAAGGAGGTGGAAGGAAGAMAGASVTSATSATSATSGSPATSPSNSSGGLNGSYDSPPSGLAAIIGTTTLLATPQQGLWTLSYYLHMLKAGSGGTITLTVGWQDEASAQTIVSANLSLTTLGMAQGVVTIRTASPQPVTFSTATSGAEGSWIYGLSVRLVPLS